MSEQEVTGARVKRVVLEDGQLVVTGTRNQEHELVVSLNHETAQKIMETAGIDKNNPNYDAYYAQAMAAAHHNRRFNGDEDTMIKVFAKEMQKPDMTPEKLKNFERGYRNYVVEEQQKYAGGDYADRDPSAMHIDEVMQNTVRSGVELRNKINPTFPDIMYDNGMLTDVVLDLSDETTGSSAIGIINNTVDKYDKYGIKFDAENNQFQVKGKPVNVQKFYSSKKNQMDKFLSNLEKNGGFDASDKELFEVIETGDYQKFLELKKQRGGTDKRNMFLRNALNDEILFDRFSEEVKGKEHSLENITEAAKNLSEDYGSKSNIINKESERGKISSAPNTDLKANEIDRIVFTAKPFQVASQSTYQNWISCMNAVGCNHRYVDDSIGQGSIVAYGYNSKNPQNKISRLLIHPYINEKGETLYVVNDRIYGESNSAFQNSVKEFTESVNQGKKGFFLFNTNKMENADGLYNDNGGKTSVIYNMENVKLLDLSNYKEIALKSIDLSSVSEIKFPENVKFYENVKLGGKVDLSNVQDLKLPNIDLSQVKSIKFPENVEFNSDVKLGGEIDFSNVKNLTLQDMDLSDAKSIKFPENVEFNSDVKLGGEIDLSNIKDLYIQHTDLSKAKNIKFPDNVKIGTGVRFGGNVDFSNIKDLKLEFVNLSNATNVKFPENVSLNYVSLCDNIDLSNIKNLELKNTDLTEVKNIKFPENIKFADNVKINKDTDLSQIKNLTIEGSDNIFTSEFDVSKDIKFPENVKFNNIKLREGTDFRSIKNLELNNVDLSQCKTIMFNDNVKLNGYINLGNNNDLSQIKNLELNDIILSDNNDIKFPENTTFKGNTKLNGTIDLSNVKNLELQNMDLSEVKEVRFPKDVKFNDNIIFGGSLDFSQTKNLDLNGVDLSNSHFVKLPETVKISDYTQLPKNIDTSNIKNLEINRYDALSYVEKMKIPESTNIKITGPIEVNNAKSLNRLKNSDISEVNAVLLSGDVYSQIKEDKITLPDNVPIVWEKDGKIYGVANEQGKQKLASLLGDNFNEKDFMSPEEFSQKEGVKFETSDSKTEAKSQEAEVKAQEPEAKPQEAEVKAQEPEAKPQEAEVKAQELKETLKQQKAETKTVQNEAANNTKTTNTPMAANENTPELKETLKEQKEAAHQAKNIPAQTPVANGDLRNTLKAQKEHSSLGSKVSAVSNSIDNTLEKAGKVLNDNAAGRAINKIEGWQPKNKVVSKVKGAVGVVPAAVIAATGVTAYEQYKSGDKKGAAATMAKGTIHATIQGAATAGGMNLAARGLAKGTEKVVTKVTERNLTKKVAQKTAIKTAEKTAAKVAEKEAAKVAIKAGAKAAGKAAGKAVLKKIPFVSLAAGAYFAFERAKDGEWGKAGCELLSGAAGCVPGVGTAASTAIDCGLAVSDAKQAVDKVKKQQNQQQQKQTKKSPEQIKQEQKKKAAMAKRAEELRNTKPGQSQKKPAPAKKQPQKPVEKGVWDKFTDWFSR